MDIIQIQQSEMLQALNKSEVDIQISTAKQYPRHLPETLNKIATYATMDAETAEDCFYAIRRGGDVIEGISVRMAEIIAGAWGNMRIQTRIIGNDGKTITAQGVCHDLETNIAISVEVKRRITDKQGRTFSEDMQVVTGNAASAIAFRNAVLKVVPKAVTKKVIDEVKQVALGKSIDMETGRQNAIANYKKRGVSEQILFDYLSITKREEIDKEKLFALKATLNAINEGTTTVEDEFINPAKEKKAAEEAAKKTDATKDKVKEAMDAATSGKGATKQAGQPQQKSLL
jgi:phosphoribosylformylglycinamidine (FGAM) synthase PurS component